MLSPKVRVILVGCGLAGAVSIIPLAVFAPEVLSGLPEVLWRMLQVALSPGMIALAVVVILGLVVMVGFRRWARLQLPARPDRPYRWPWPRGLARANHLADTMADSPEPTGSTQGLLAKGYPPSLLAQIETIRAMARDRKTDSEIAVEVNASESSVYRARQALGLKKWGKKPPLKDS